MDATTLTGHVKELNAANQAGKSDVSGALGVGSQSCLRQFFRASIADWRDDGL